MLVRIIFVAVVVFCSLLAQADDCVQVRAAFDVGSGTTKMKVAKVDVCVQKIIDILVEQDLPVSYKDDLEDSEAAEFSESIVTEGIRAISKLRSEARFYKPDSYTAVATSAFRDAKNSSDVIKKIKAETGINIAVISQETEAKIGFAAASTIADNAINDIVVWDIGGGSMQISTYDKNNKFSSYEGQLAAVSFKDHIIQNIQDKSMDKVKSPNPISGVESVRATDFAEAFSVQEVPDSILEKIKAGAQVLGIGGVHYYSVRSQTMTNTTSFTKNDVQWALSARAGMTDSEIGGDYASTEISNLALVVGFMKGLGIQAVKVGKINLADGLLVAPELAQ